MKISSNSTHGLIAMWLLAALTGTATAHTWPEGTIRLSPDGSMVGKPGFDRAHVNSDAASYLVPPAPRGEVGKDDKLVSPRQATLSDASYSDATPMLSAAPGDWVAIQYRENGHVSRAEIGDKGKPVNRGTVYIYGTTENDLSAFTMKGVHLAWTADGKGGDGKGKLLATRHYDDGQCHEILPSDGDLLGILGYRKQHVSKADSLLCQNDFQIPEDAPVGKVYTVIWVWDWPTMNVPGVAVSPATYELNKGEPHIVKSQIYTGVLDFKVVDPCDASLGDVKGPGCSQGGNVKANAGFAADQAASMRAIATQMAEPFLVKVPQAGFDVPSATADAKNIPFSVLIGQEPTQFPFPTSILAAQNIPGAAGGGGGNAPAPTPAPNNGAAGGGADDDEVVVTTTATVPESMATQTVTRAPKRTPAARLFRAPRGRRGADR